MTFLSFQPHQTAVATFPGAGDTLPTDQASQVEDPVSTDPVSSERPSGRPVSRIRPAAARSLSDANPSAHDAAARTVEGQPANDPEHERRESAVVVRPALEAPSYQFTLLQQWEGKVVHVGDDDFLGVVHDLTCPDNEPEEVEFGRSEVPDGDLSLLEPGAIFYWSIGLKRYDHGQVERTSSIRFRRTPRWSPGSIHALARDVDRLETRLGLRR